MPLTKKLFVLLSALVLVFCAMISFFQYRINLNQVLQDKRVEMSEQVQEGVSAVNTELARTEVVLQELAYAQSVRSALNESNPDRYITRLMFHATENIKFSESFLSGIGANIYLLVPDERMPESYDLAVHLSRMNGNREFEEYLAGTDAVLWGQMQNELPMSEYGGKVIPYYQKVASAPMKWSGIIRCSLQADRLFEPLSMLSEGAYLLFSSGEHLTAGSPFWEIPDGVPGSGWITDRERMYYSASVDRLNVTVLTSTETGPLQAKALSETVRSLVPILLLGALLMLVTCIVVRQMMRRMVQMTGAVSRMRSGEDLRQFLPEPGQDEAGQLALAFLELNDRSEKYYSALAQEEKDKRHAQQMALQYQLNPHFLFNALYWLQLQSEENGMPPDVSESISQLGEVLHYNLEGHFSAELAEEKQLALAFVSFMGKMKGTEISLETDLPPELEQIKVPRFILQPIIENAIHHGLISGQTLHIRISFCREDGDMLSVVISNDGREISGEQLDRIREKITHAREWLEQGGKSIGLANVKRRLELVYGDAAAMEVSSAGGRTTVRIRIPMKIRDAGIAKKAGGPDDEYTGG